jgi:hypothetical protein
VSALILGAPSAAAGRRYSGASLRRVRQQGRGNGVSEGASTLMGWMKQRGSPGPSGS